MFGHEIILTIQELLSGQEWSPDTIAEIAELLHENGYAIENIE